MNRYNRDVDVLVERFRAFYGFSFSQICSQMVVLWCYISVIYGYTVC